jgi:hypothetical protein
MTKSARFLWAAMSLLGVISLAACTARGDKRLEAAKALISADPDLEIVATDERAGVITVRVKSTGQINVLKAEDVQAGKLVKQASAAERAEAAAAGGVSATATGDGVRLEGGGARVKATDGSGGKKGLQVDAADGTSVTLGGSGGGVKIDAPGASVRLGGGHADGAVEVGTPRAGVTGGGGGGGGRSERPVRRKLTDPVTCRSDQNVRLERVRIEVAGDAVIAEDNCNLFIIDSEIVAGGWAVLTRGAADVVIEDSLIDGRRGAVSVGGSGDVTAKSSTLRGRIDRSGEGDFHDRGGNQKLPGR